MVFTFFWIYFKPSGDMLSVGGNIPLDYEGIYDDFVNLKIMCWLSLSDVLIGVGCVRLILLIDYLFLLSHACSRAQLLDCGFVLT